MRKVVKLPTATASSSKSARRLEASRALPLFQSLEPNLKTFRVDDNGSEPHIRFGEYAVVDPTDRDPTHDELFIIQYDGGERRRHVVHVRSSYVNITGPGAADTLVYWVSDLAGFRQVSRSELGGIPVFAGLSDGPYTSEHLKQKLIGRVVGIAKSSLGNLIAPSAGWVNEVEGNAAFDPAEYIDTLLATGCRPWVVIAGDGRQCYGETFPERAELPAEREAVMIVRGKYARASTALDRVIEECRKRGLVDHDATMRKPPRPHRARRRVA